MKGEVGGGRADGAKHDKVMTAKEKWDRRDGEEPETCESAGRR